MRAVLILNPVAGESIIAEAHEEHEALESTEERILRALQTYGIEPEVWYTTVEEPGEGLARQAADEGVDLVIVAGGDGTVHSVAGGLIGRETTLGIIPMGSMNNLAHSLGIPLPIEAACAVIAKGETRAIDVGQMNGEIFIEVAGAGLEAALFPPSEEFKTPGLFMTIRGVVGGLITLLSFRPTKLKIAFDEQPDRCYEAIQITVCNAPYYGIHFQAAPEALMDDGLLDVLIYKHFSKLEYIRHAIAISQGRRLFQPKISHRRVRSLRISADHPVEIQADGFPHGYTPAEITVMPAALRVRTHAQNAPGLRREAITAGVHK